MNAQDEAKRLQKVAKSLTPNTVLALMYLGKYEDLQTDAEGAPTGALEELSRRDLIELRAIEEGRRRSYRLTQDGRIVHMILFMAQQETRVAEAAFQIQKSIREIGSTGSGTVWRSPVNELIRALETLDQAGVFTKLQN